VCKNTLPKKGPLYKGKNPNRSSTGRTQPPTQKGESQKKRKKNPLGTPKEPEIEESNPGDKNPFMPWGKDPRGYPSLKTTDNPVNNLYLERTKFPKNSKKETLFLEPRPKSLEKQVKKGAPTKRGFLNQGHPVLKISLPSNLPLFCLGPFFGKPLVWRNFLRKSKFSPRTFGKSPKKKWFLPP